MHLNLKKRYRKELIDEKFAFKTVNPSHRTNHFLQLNYSNILKGDNQSMSQVELNLTSGQNFDDIRYIYWQIYLNSYKKNRPLINKIGQHPDLTCEDSTTLITSFKRVREVSVFSTLFTAVAYSYKLKTKKLA